MKSVGRSAVFVLALGFGTAAVWGWSFIAGSVTASLMNAAAYAFPGQTNNESVESAIPGDVKVNYSGIGHDEDGRPYLRFLVHNRSFSTISYDAFSPTAPFSQAMIDGRKLKWAFRCGTGMVSHTILPFGTAEFRVKYWDYLEKPASGTIIQIGFWFNNGNDEQASEYYSEPFNLPEEFRRAVMSSYPG